MTEKPKSQPDESAEPKSAAAPETAAGSAKGSLSEQLEAARAERDSNYDLYLRAQAELQNYRKRAQKESDEIRQCQALPLARDLLPALDNLHRAVTAAEKSHNTEELIKGVRMVV